MTTQAESMPLSDYLASMGVDPAQAATLGAQGNEISRNRGLGLRESAHPAAQEMLRQSANPAAKDPFATGEQSELHGHLDKVFAAPAEATDYHFEHGIAEPTAEQAATNSAIKAELHSFGMPKFVVDSIAHNLFEASSKPPQLQATTASLKGMWGGQYDTNLKLVDTLLEQMSTDRPALAAFIGQAAPHLSALNVDALLQVAKHRAAKGAAS